MRKKARKELLYGFVRDDGTRATTTASSAEAAHRYFGSIGIPLYKCKLIADKAAFLRGGVGA